MPITVTVPSGGGSIVVSPAGTVVPPATDVQIVLTGPPGPQGPPGDAGTGGGAYTFTQASPSATWTINHSLGRYVNVTVIVGGVEVFTDETQPSTSQVVLTFPSPTSGVAVLS